MVCGCLDGGRSGRFGGGLICRVWPAAPLWTCGAERAHGLAAILFCGRALRRHLFTLREFESALVGLAWGTMILYSAMRLLLNPSAFSGSPGFVGVGNAAEDPGFAFQPYFILFGAYYYAFRGFRTGRARDYVLAILLFSGAMDKAGGRSLIVAFMLSFLFFLLRWTEGRRRLLVVPKSVAGITLLVGLLYLVLPAQVAERAGKFQDAFTATFTGKEVEDASAAARVLEVVFVLPGIQKHPVFGNGFLSNQWQGGRESVLGEYFHPSDIGLFGVMYSVGLFGTILFGWQYVFAVRSARAVPRCPSTPLMDATKGFLLFSAIVSLTSGIFVIIPEASLFFVALIQVIAMDAAGIDDAHIGTAGAVP